MAVGLKAKVIFDYQRKSGARRSTRQDCRHVARCDRQETPVAARWLSGRVGRFMFRIKAMRSRLPNGAAVALGEGPSAALRVHRSPLECKSRPPLSRVERRRSRRRGRWAGRRSDDRADASSPFEGLLKDALRPPSTVGGFPTAPIAAPLPGLPRNPVAGLPIRPSLPILKDDPAAPAPSPITASPPGVTRNPVAGLPIRPSVPILEDDPAVPAPKLVGTTADAVLSLHSGDIRLGS